jgi:predicted transcriptional regulator
MSNSLAVKLDDAIRDRLRALAEKRDRSPHWLMKAAILEYLEREEAYERERAEDESRWQDYLLTGAAVPHEDVAPWLESYTPDTPRPWQR